jgi:hypothetical protein
LSIAASEGAVSPILVEKLEAICEQLVVVQANATTARESVPEVWRHVRMMLDVIADQSTEIARLKRNERQNA